MDKLKYIKLKNEDGSYTDSIPLAVDSNYVDVDGNTLTSTLGTLATKVEVQAIASGSPAGVYATVAALTSVDPDHSKIYLVSTDGHWYYYNGSTWADGGAYQAGVNSDDVEDLKDTVGYSINTKIAPSYTYTNTRIFNGVPAAITGNFSVAKISVPKIAKKIKLNNIVGNQYYDKIAFYTSDTTFTTSTLIEYEIYSKSGSYEKNIPDNAVTMLLQSNTNINGSVVSGDSYEFIYNDVDDRLSTLETLTELVETNLETTESEVNENSETLGYHKHEDLIPNYTYEGYIINVSGILTTISLTSFKVAKIANLEGKNKLKLNNIIANTGVSKVAFYNSLTTFNQSTLIEKYNYDSAGSYEVTIPEGAVIMLLQNNVTTSGNIISGDSYQFISKDVNTRLLELNNKDYYNRIVLPDTIYSYVGDKMHLYFDSFIESTAEYTLTVSCSKGKIMKDYYELNPISGDTGTFDFTITMYDLNGRILATKTSTLKIVNPTNPVNSKNILCVGDSTMTSGQIPIESSRVISGTTGSFNTPSSLNLSNYKFKGRKTNGAGTVGWEGTGGWSYSTYNSSGVSAVRFNVTDITNVTVGDVYSVGGSNLSIVEINVTGGTGNIRFTGSVGSISASGTLTKVSGSGQSTVNYTSYQSENYQPFWNNSTNQFDIETYVNEYCNNSLDTIAVLLGINTIAAQPTFSKLNGLLNDVNTFVSNVHNQLPNTKILLSTVPVQADDIGANYNTSNVYGNINYKGYKHKILTFNQKLIDYAKDLDYVEVINTSAETWNKYCYPHNESAFSDRYTEKIIKYTNVVHPSANGYAEWSDSFTRAILNN